MKRQLGESTKITHKASRTDPAGPTSLQLCKKPKIETAVSIDTPSRAHTNPTFSPGAPIQASAGSSSRLKRKAEQSRAKSTRYLRDATPGADQDYRAVTDAMRHRNFSGSPITASQLVYKLPRRLPATARVAE